MHRALHVGDADPGDRADLARAAAVAEAGGADGAADAVGADHQVLPGGERVHVRDPLAESDRYVTGAVRAREQGVEQVRAGDNVAGPGRARLLAVLELQAEATRRPWLSGILDPMASGDFAGFELAQRAAGLPVTPQRAAVVTLALHAAVPHLLTDGPGTLAAAGLDDPDRFVRDLLDTVYPPDATAP
ncbi:TetR/AcrR family transcriptional regulator [Streptomyces sp. NPDC002533]